MKCVTMDSVKPKALSPGMYAIDVEPIPPCNKKNREVHLDYLKHLKESVETLREIVEEARKPKHVSSSINVIIEKLSNTSQKPLTRYKRRNTQDKAISSSIPTTAETQTTDAYVKCRTDRPWYLDSGCSKPMMGNRSWLKNFVKKFIGTVRFRNDHFGAIMGYGDYVIGDSVISRVYYVEELRHNLFSVGQFYDSDLEVAFRKHSCYVRNEDGVDLLKGSCGSNIFTWVKFLRSKDETSEFVINFLKQIQVGLNKIVRFIRIDNGTEFNGVVERRNRTLMEAARTMMIFSKALMFLWAEAIATAFFGALCYPRNDSEDLEKLKATIDIGIFVGYAPNRKGYRIYNKRTQRIMENIHVEFNKLSELMDPVHISSGPEPIS
ncbi:retrovirus-related pol polyprotein from transposon TNT 1-94 [Tanacetum coccineum]